MFTDATRMMTPAGLRQAMLDQGQRALSFQKQLFDFQQGQVRAAEKQMIRLWDLSMEGVAQAQEAAQKLGAETLGSLKSDERAEA